MPCQEGWNPSNEQPMLQVTWKKRTFVSYTLISIWGSLPPNPQVGIAAWTAGFAILTCGDAEDNVLSYHQKPERRRSNSAAFSDNPPVTTMIVSCCSRRRVPPETFPHPSPACWGPVVFHLHGANRRFSNRHRTSRARVLAYVQTARRQPPNPCGEHSITQGR